MRLKTELQDHKTEIKKVPKPFEQRLCKDAVWVECPLKALKMDKTCAASKDDWSQCPHRGETTISWKWVHIVVDKETGLEVSEPVEGYE